MTYAALKGRSSTELHAFLSFSIIEVVPFPTVYETPSSKIVSRELMATFPSTRTLHWYGIPVRVLLVTFIGALLCFAISLLLAILGTVIAAKLRGVHPDMRIAYRLIALPAAVGAGVAILVTMLIMEIRRYRQMKALSAIERMN
ncbi:MAG TPA: hypothetical protein VIH89_14630 [Candidatus Sulfotelmatobacter sp.]|jgi:hypothetical protein